MSAETSAPESEADTDTAIFVPANTVHSMVATPEEGVIFYVVKDLTHGIAGLPADGVDRGAHYEPGFGAEGNGGLAAVVGVCRE